MQKLISKLQSAGFHLKFSEGNNFRMHMPFTGAGKGWCEIAYWESTGMMRIDIRWPKSSRSLYGGVNAVFHADPVSKDGKGFEELFDKVVKEATKKLAKRQANLMKEVNFHGSLVSDVELMAKNTNKI